MSGVKTYGSDRGVTMPAQNIYEESSTQKQRLGARLVLGDRTFRYGHFVYACAAGLIAAPDQSLVGADNLLADGSCVALAAATAFTDQPAITAALAANDTWLALTHASALDNVTEDVLKNGYICISDSANYDQVVRIKRNSVMASDIVAIELYDPILTATADATTGVTFSLSPWSQLRPAATGTDDNPSGAPQVAVQAGYYAWVQTGGIGMAVTTTDTAFAGIDVELAGTGQVATRDTDGVEPRIGIGLADVTTAGDATLIQYQLSF